VKVSTERLPESQVVLQIEVEDERLEQAMASAYRRLAAKVKIPGFRPGKVPRAILERHLGEHAILHEAIERLLPQVYREALEQEALDPIDQAEYELVTEQPFVAKFTVPVHPSVDLGDYTSLRVPREPVVVEPERVQEGLEALHHRYATLEPVSRPVRWGDIVRADVQGTVDGAVIVQEDDAEFQLLEDRTISLPGFAEALIGREKGAEFEFEVDVSEDAADVRVRGRQAHYQVRVMEVKEEILPELDDDFARQVGEGFPSLAALRSRIEEDLRRALENEAEHRYHDRILEALVQRVQLEYPPVLVERETERLLREQSGASQSPRSRSQAGGRSGTASQDELDRYLQQAGKSEEELRAELRPLAEDRVRRSIVLSQVLEAENIQVTDAEVEAEISRLSSGAGGQADEVRRLFSSESAKESLRRSLMTKKTLERLVQIASADGATPEEAQASATRKG
jgi:trigger factor